MQFLTNALITKMKVEVGTKVAVTGEREISEAFEHTVEVDFPLHPCSAKRVLKKVHHRSAHGSIVGSDCKTVCACNGCSATQTTYCNRVEVTGSGTGYESGTTTVSDAAKPTNCSVCTNVPPTPPPVNNVTIVFPPLFPVPLVPSPDPISGNPPLPQPNSNP